MNRERKKVWYFELFDIYIYIYIYIYPLHIEEVDINRKPNVNLICEGVKLKSKS